MLLGARLKKALALLILISFIPHTALAQEEQTGRFTRLAKSAPSPFEAWCFDDLAFAKLKTKIDSAEDRCNLRLERQKENLSARYGLEISNLELRLSTLKKQTDSIIEIKNEEIAKLEKAALQRPNDYSHWWATGGFFTGALVTIGIFFAVN